MILIFLLRDLAVEKTHKICIKKRVTTRKDLSDYLDKNVHEVNCGKKQSKSDLYYKSEVLDQIAAPANS